jgi:hypothetical protein
MSKLSAHCEPSRLVIGALGDGVPKEDELLVRGLA